MSWNAMLGMACIVSFLLPVTVILYNRFYTFRSLNALLIYFFVAATSNLVSYLPVPVSLQTNYAILSNYLDVPLMLTGLLFFCPNRQRQKPIEVLIVSFIGYELVVTAFHGFSRVSVTYIIGPGFTLVLLYAAYLFAKQARFGIMHRKNQGRMMMLAAVLFAYACYTLVYYFYYIEKTPYKSDVMSIYFIASFAASVLMAIGLHLLRKRIRELQSIRTTRRELELFFSHS